MKLFINCEIDFWTMRKQNTYDEQPTSKKKKKIAIAF